MKYLNKSFSVFMGSKDYEKNYDNIFKKSLKEKIKNFIDKILFNLFIKEIK